MRIVRHMDIQGTAWMTKWRTVLWQKGSSKRNVFENFRQITCFPLILKLMTGIISNNIYKYLDNDDLLPVDQKRRKRKSSRMKEQSLIDKPIFADCKKIYKKLAMVWVYFRKAFYMVPHSWITECFKLPKGLPKYPEGNKKTYEQCVELNSERKVISCEK